MGPLPSAVPPGTPPDHALLAGVVQRHEELRLLTDVADEVAHAEVEVVGGRSRQAGAAAQLALLWALWGRRWLSPTARPHGTALQALGTAGPALALTISSWMRCVMVCAAFLCAWKRLMTLVLSGSRMFSSSSRTTRSSARILQGPGWVRWDPAPGELGARRGGRMIPVGRGQQQPPGEGTGAEQHQGRAPAPPRAHWQ